MHDNDFSPTPQRSINQGTGNLRYGSFSGAGGLTRTGVTREVISPCSNLMNVVGANFAWHWALSISTGRPDRL